MLCSLAGFTNVSEMLTAFITLKVVVSTSKTVVNIYQTAWHNMHEESHLHTCCYGNLKSHQIKVNHNSLLKWSANQ
jgi:hypothetical protein